MRKIQTIVGVLIVVCLMAFAVEGAQQKAVQKDESLRKGETRATLDPNIFNDPRIRKAYQVAKDIPWVIDSIYCYCFCQESPAFRHKSLLSCFVDNHAAM